MALYDVLKKAHGGETVTVPHDWNLTGEEYGFPLSELRPGTIITNDGDADYQWIVNIEGEESHIALTSQELAEGGLVPDSVISGLLVRVPNGYEAHCVHNGLNYTVVRDANEHSWIFYSNDNNNRFSANVGEVASYGLTADDFQPPMPITSSDKHKMDRESAFDRAVDLLNKSEISDYSVDDLIKVAQYLTESDL